MYQLTVSFETKEELIAYLQGGVETAIPATVEVKAPAKSRAKPAAKPTVESAPVVEVEMPLSSPQPIAAPQASVAPAPTSPAPTGVNRDAVIEDVRRITNDLKSKCNLSDGVVQNIFAEIHVGLGTTGKKVSELEDSKLLAFHSAYSSKAQAFFGAAQTQAQQTNASAFI